MDGLTGITDIAAAFRSPTSVVMMTYKNIILIKMTQKNLLHLFVVQLQKNMIISPQM